MRYGFLTRFHDSPLVHSAEQFIRRQSWLLDGMTPRKLANLTLAGLGYAAKRESIDTYPLILKVDISPLCNLRCPVCIHAKSDSRLPLLAQQKFSASQKMSLEQFSKIVDEVEGKTLALSLYYIGDPYMHPDLDEMCAIARAANINVHVSSNFSFNFSSERIASIVRSGLTHLTVCVDGLTQSTYARTRIGGNVDLVLANLRRICQYKQRHRLDYPKVEVQMLRYEHNRHELEPIRRLARDLGVDDVTDYAGMTDNWTEQEPENWNTLGPKRTTRLPLCFWPYISMVIKYDGDVVPCCYHRQGKQYTNLPDKRVVGNVFESSVRAVWNCDEYKRIRRLVSSPERVRTDDTLSRSFCEGCSVVFENERAQN
jgi:MoaA/NifB/PqqE/SkfB family radical SAM enzyme